MSLSELLREEMDLKETVDQKADQDLAPVPFDPSRTFGIIKRKALIKDLASAYHAAVFRCCQELLDLQKEEDFTQRKLTEDTEKEMTRPLKHLKKAR